MPSNPQKKVQGFDEFWVSNPQNRGHQVAGASRGLCWYALDYVDTAASNMRGTIGARLTQSKQDLHNF